MASGHPSSCSSATLGSVCHCECGGVRHSWMGGDMPSAVKVPQNNPALDGLSGDRTPAAPASTAPEPTGGGGTALLAGDEALASAPHSIERDTGLSDDESRALRNYRSITYSGINRRLRSGNTDINDKADEAQQRAIDGIDSAMSASQLPQPVETYRGVFDEGNMFGGRLAGDMTGMEWREDAYMSTTVDLNVAEGFSDDGDGAVLMHITVPAGTGAVQLSSASGGNTVHAEAELLLQRGLRLRVVADRGVDSNGIRRLDVEVIPGG